MLRITGGTFRGRSIQAPSGSQTRPSQAKLRQALFNSLQFSWPEARVLDLFSGSGSLGFEALSRGARQVVFVEKNPAALRCITANADALQVQPQVHLIHSAWPLPAVQLEWLERQAPFDVVLADPPYREGWERKLLEFERWDPLLPVGGYFCLEWAPERKGEAQPERTGCLVKVREKNYGDSWLTTYQRNAEE